MVKPFNEKINLDIIKPVSNNIFDNDSIIKVSWNTGNGDNVDEIDFDSTKEACSDRFLDGDGYNNDSLDIIIEREYTRDSEGNKIEPAFKSREEVIDKIEKLNKNFSDYPGFIYYNQNLYLENYKYDTIQNSGCCPTCFAMVATYLTGKETTPLDVIEAFNPYCFPDGTDVTGDCFPDVSSQFGLEAEKIDWHNKDAIVKELNEGHPIILNVGKGDFTSSGHFIVLLGINNDGKVVVADPNSISNSITNYDIDSILAQTANIENAAWSFK